MDLNSDSTIYYSGDCGQGTLLGLLVHHYLLGGVRISLGAICKNGTVGSPRVHPSPETFLKTGQKLSETTLSEHRR